MATPTNLISTSLFVGASTSNGANSFDLSGSTGTFKTTTGAITIGNGAISITGATTFSSSIAASGSSAIDFSGGSGIFKTSTGTNTLSGNVTLSDTKTFTSSFTNAGAARQNIFSLQNTQAATSSVMQWSPFTETIGHGWTYLPAVSTSNLSRTAGAAPWTVTITTGTNHGFASGINIYIQGGDGYFVAGQYGPIVVTGAQTFTYTTSTGASSGGNAVSENVVFTIFDFTGQDQAVKVSSGLRPAIGLAGPNIGFSDSTMTSPEMVYFRSSYPNNGSYGEWFKFSATDPFNSYGGLYTTAGVSLIVPKADDVTTGSYLSVQPSRVALIDDHGIGFYSIPSASIPNTAGLVSMYGSLIFDAGIYAYTSLQGAGLGIPSAPWYDFFGVRGDFQNLGIGDLGTIRWNDFNVISPAAGVSWFNSSGMGYGPYGLSTIGGSSRFAILPAASNPVITPTSGTSVIQAYSIVAVDRNGYSTLAATVGTTVGPVFDATSSSATHFNTLSWTTSFSTIPLLRYDIYRSLTIGSVTLSRSASAVVTVTGATSHGLSTGNKVYIVGGNGSNSSTFATNVFTVTAIVSTSSFLYTDASDTTHTGTLSTSVVPLIVAQNTWIGAVSTPTPATTATFKDTGAARYTNGGNFGAIQQPVMTTGTWTGGGGSGTSTTYGVYAMDADGYLIASTTASASFTNGPSITNPWTITWTPVGGTVAYILCRGDLSHPISIQTQTGIQTATGTPTNGFVKLNTSTTVTVTITAGHGLRVGDSIVISGLINTVQFANGTYSVVTVTSATVFTYTDGVTNSSGSTQTTTGTFAGPGVVTSSFSDYGYPTRQIGFATRNTTSDVTMDGQLQVTTQAAGNAMIVKGNANNLSALQTWQDSAGKGHFGIDSMGLPSLGSRYEYRENWLFGNSPVLGTTNATWAQSPVGAPLDGYKFYINGSNSTSNGSFVNGAGLVSGYPAGAGITLAPGTANTNYLVIQMGSAFVQLANLTNLYVIVEWQMALSALSTNNTYRVGWSHLSGGSITLINSGQLISSSGPTSTPSGAWFENVNGGTWSCKTCDGTNTTTTTNIATPVANTMQSFRMEYYGSGTVLGAATIVFYVDNSRVATHTTNVYNASHVTWNAGGYCSGVPSPATSILIGPLLFMYNLVATPLIT